MSRDVGAVLAIAHRDVVKLLRDRARLLTTVIFPVLLVAILGGTMQANLGQAAGYNFVGFTFIGVLGMSVFQSASQGVISLIEDRENDFSKEMFVAPVARVAIVLGKVIGETMVALINVVPMAGLAIFLGVAPGPLGAAGVLVGTVCAALLGASFGVAALSIFSAQRTAQQLFGFVMFPQFFLAGVFNPINILPLPLEILSRVMPMRYAIDLLRNAYYLGRPEGRRVVLDAWPLDLGVSAAFFAVFIVAGTILFVRNERNR